MSDLVAQIRNAKPWIGKLGQDAAAEIERLYAAVRRIDAINDNPAHFNVEINEVCDSILRPHLSSAVPSDQRQTGE